MRIVSGALGGRILKSPSHDNIRPTTDRVREALFSILASRTDLEGIAVCDLFAGSGACGIEALSRGAASAVFVENSRRSLEVLRANIALLGLEKQSRVMPLAAERFLESSTERFNLVFADPPYTYRDHTALVETVIRNSLLMRGGLLVVEHASSTRLEKPPNAVIVDSRTYGMASITIFEDGSKEAL